MGGIQGIDRPIPSLAARMYGYRRKDIGSPAAFPSKRASNVVFRAINKMERDLLELIALKSDEEFVIYVESGLSTYPQKYFGAGIYRSSTRGGSNYNPAQGYATI